MLPIVGLYNLAEDEEAIRKILEESDLSDFTDSDEDCWEPKLNVAAQRGLAVSSSDSSDEEGPSDTGTPRLKTSSIVVSFLLILRGMGIKSTQPRQDQQHLAVRDHRALDRPLRQIFQLREAHLHC